MGKVAAAVAAAATATTDTKKKRKKKGRPSLLDLQKRNLNHPQSPSSPNPNFANFPTRRSSRRNPNPDSLSSDLFIDDDDDDDDERKEKKVKLVVRLPQSNQHFSHNPRSSARSLSLNSGSDSNADGDNHEASVKKRKIDVDAHRSNDVVADQGEKASKATDTLHGSPLVSGPTTPLPDKKLLVFILDRLQKKDTYGVFSEPVDPNELPDYHEIIQHPMDFGTVRQKLDEGLYSNLEELEADVFLICTNAMQYNAPDTIYFRQARSIQELAKRDFENLRQEGDDGEPQPKVVRRGRPPGKSQKKPPSRSPVDRVGPEISSGATLASAEDNAAGSNSYCQKKGSMLYRFRSTDGFANTHSSRNVENGSELSCDWNNEFPASILRADMKYGKKQFTVDENKRDTYKEFLPSSFRNVPSQLSSFDENAKQFMAVGLHVEHSYARSLAQFAANLGPVVWKIASKKIARALPNWVKFGPGWVGENEALPQQLSFYSERKSVNNSSHGMVASRIEAASNPEANSNLASSCEPHKEETFETDSESTLQNELALLVNGFTGMRPGSIQTQQKPFIYTDKTSLNGVTGYDVSSGVGSRPTMSMGQSEEVVPVSSQMAGVTCGSDTLCTRPASRNNIDSESGQTRLCRNKNTFPSGSLLVPDTGIMSRRAPEVELPGKLARQLLSTHKKQYPFPVPPDLNVRYQAPGSPSSSLRTGSPQQPDLALQL